MKIKVLGAGSAFTLKGYNSSFLIENNGKNLLYDAGTDIRFALDAQGLSYKDIDALFISHEHADHCGGLEYLAYCTFCDPDVKHKIKFMGNAYIINFLRDMYRTTLKPLEKYFDVFILSEYDWLPKNYWGDATYQAIAVPHIMDDESRVDNYGLFMLTSDYEKLYITGDSQFCPDVMMGWYENADVIIQDCETYPFKSGVHAHYTDLVTLPEEIKEKMWLTHVNDNILKDDGTVVDEWVKKVYEDGFMGILEKGMVIEL